MYVFGLAVAFVAGGVAAIIGEHKISYFRRQLLAWLEKVKAGVK